MQIRSKIVFGCAAKEIFCAGKTELELFQPGNEQLLAKTIWESFVSCQMTNNYISYRYLELGRPDLGRPEPGYVGRIGYKTPNQVNGTASVISSNIDVNELTNNDFGFPRRPAASYEEDAHQCGQVFQPSAGRLSKKRAEDDGKILGATIIFSFKEISDENIWELFERIFSLEKDFRPRELPEKLPAHPSLKSIVDLAKYLVRVDFCPLPSFSQKCTLQSLAENQLADFVPSLNNKSPLVTASVFSPSTTNDWFKAITDEKLAEKALFAAFRGDEPYASMTEVQHISLITQYPKAAATVLRLKGNEPKSDKDSCLIM